MKLYHVFSMFVLLALVLSACAPAATPTQEVPVTAATATTAPTATSEPTAAPQTIVDVAVADGRFTTLAAALGAAGLVETLQGEGPFTVFAPTDDAFAKLPEGTVEDLLKPENKDQLIAILTYHVVAGKVMAADVAGLTEAATVQGEMISVKSDMGKVMINEAEVVLADVEASNGVIHVIDSVLLPPSTQAAELDIVDTAVANGSFTTLAAALEAAGLIETLKGEGPFTVFAPTDEAFAKLPAGTVEDLLKPENKDQLVAILTYHVVAGKVMAADVAGLTEAETVQGEMISVKSEMGKVMINDATVALADVAASNGVIHVIDTVLLPPSTQTADIVDTAVANGSFTTLAAALEAAGLIETLKGEGPFTVFAPTDEAFAKLPAGTVENLLKPENKDQLIAILTYHVVAGKVMAADVIKLSEAETVQGGKVTIKTEMDKVMINDATVTLADVEASNGVIHVIDTVILPPAN